MPEILTTTYWGELERLPVRDDMNKVYPSQFRTKNYELIGPIDGPGENLARKLCLLSERSPESFLLHHILVENCNCPTQVPAFLARLGRKGSSKTVAEIIYDNWKKDIWNVILSVNRHFYGLTKDDDQNTTLRLVNDRGEEVYQMWKIIKITR